MLALVLGDVCENRILKWSMLCVCGCVDVWMESELNGGRSGAEQNKNRKCQGNGNNEKKGNCTMRVHRHERPPLPLPLPLP